MSQTYFWIFYLLFLARKIALYFRSFYVRFCEPKKTRVKISNKVLWHLYPKAQNPTTPFSTNYFVNNDLPYCTLRSAQFFFYIKIYHRRRNSFPGKCRSGLRYLSLNHIFWHFYLKFWARRIALKTSKNAGNSATFEHQKLLIKIE